MNTYDLVPYPAGSYPLTNPDHLATIASLFGMEPAPIDHCRVLELGCGDATNLLPMASRYPESTFVGVELANAPAELGRQRAHALGLRNIEILTLDCTLLPEETGPFDYVIAHGLYSWVPAPVREQLLPLIARHLAPQGVAYVSYSAYPGGHLRRMVREMMLYHIRTFTDPQTRADQGRAFLAYVIDAQPKDTFYRRLLEREQERMDRCPDNYLLHDDLAQHNTPIYFYQFAAKARQAGLQYLSDSDFSSMQGGSLSSDAAETLNSLAEDLETREQYLDFLNNRAFRTSLLCQAEVTLDRQVQTARIDHLFAASPGTFGDEEGEAEGAEGAAVTRFRGPHGTGLTSTSPFVRAVMEELGAVWPAARSFKELEDGVRARLAAEGASSDGFDLTKLLIWLYAGDFVDLRSRPDAFVVHVSERPVASPFARMQAAYSLQLTNELHANVMLKGTLEQLLLRLLDGTRNWQTLQDDLGRLIREEKQGQEEPGAFPSADADLDADRLHEWLELLARSALLVA